MQSDVTPPPPAIVQTMALAPLTKKIIRRPIKHLHPVLPYSGKPRGRKPMIKIESVDVGAKPAKVKPPAKETDLQRRCFECYADLGDDRTREAVAESMAVPLWKVNKWSSLFGWQSRLKEFLSKSIEEQILSTAERAALKLVKIVSLRIDEMKEPHPDNPAKDILTDKATTNSLKESVNSLVGLVKFVAEKVGVKISNKELDREEGGRGGKSGVGGVMVNVIFKGIDEDV